MKTMRTIIQTIGGAGGLVLACAASGQVHPARYTITDLGHLGGGQTYPLRISESGVVVGMSTAADTQDFRAFVWQGGQMTEIGTLGGRTQGVAFDLDGAGRAVGSTFSLAGLNARAFDFAGGVLTDLGSFQAHGVSSGGAVIGSVALTVTGRGLVEHACVLEPGAGAPTDLGTLGGSTSVAHDVSDTTPRLIVGSSRIASDANAHATAWVNGVAVDLGTLGGSFSSAKAINDSLQVVGVSDAASGMPRAFAYQLSSAGAVLGRTDLGAFPAGPSAAWGINSAGDVVGTSDSRAFVWWGGRMRDLNAMIPAHTAWRLERAHSINGSGQIVGHGYHQGIPHGFLLTPSSGCAADITMDGVVNSQDFFTYLNEFFVGTPAGDFNADTVVNSVDFFEFLTAFFGCE